MLHRLAVSAKRSLSVRFIAAKRHCQMRACSLSRAGVAVAVLLTGSSVLQADVGDPQVGTDHPWYSGELDCSTFERLFAAQAELYRRVVGDEPTTDEQKALAAWYWRNTHYYHAEDGRQDLFGQGFAEADNWTREYWTGLYSFGFGLCGTTHAQWSAEMQQLLGHGRGRGVGVDGHSSFEVFLTGGKYGQGKWVLLDHDISTVIFDAQGTRLLSIPEIQADLRLTERKYLPQRQRGWLVSALHPSDAPGVYVLYGSAAYHPGYAGPPPTVHLRRGETLRRYLQPGLDDGKTFVYWGRNYNKGGIPGPERDLTWVNQPEKMYGSTTGTPATVGRARYGNAVYTYRPDFSNGDYREGVIDEGDGHVSFAFSSPYLIGATPASSDSWSIYEKGCTNGLVLHGQARCQVSVSVDGGLSWKDCGAFADGLDLTDHVKAQRQYTLRFDAGAKELVDAGLTIITVCQANAAILPRLKDDGSTVRFEAGGTAVVSTGQTVEQVRPHVVDGAFSTPHVTLELGTPKGETAMEVYAAAHVESGNPPRSDVRYHIEYSLDSGKTWKPMVEDWSIPHIGEEPPEFWSGSFCYGSASLSEAPQSKEDGSKVRVRFGNTGNKSYLRAEVQLVYQTQSKDATKVTFDWSDDAGTHRQAHEFQAGDSATWMVPTSSGVQTHWVEFEPVVDK